MATTAPSQRTKQKPACEQCRRRKLRCDGKKPQCSTCEHTGTECDINVQRAPRGPKKGHLAALQSKVAMLESRLQEHEQRHSDLSSTMSPDGTDAIMAPLPTSVTLPLTMTVSDLENVGPEPSYPDLPYLDPSMSERDSLLSTMFSESSVPGPSMTLSCGHMHATPSSTSMPIEAPKMTTTSMVVTEPYLDGISVTDQMRAELDQIYFDRISAAIPILHQRRYLSWSKLPLKTISRNCLQYAVWTMASLMSPQFQFLQETFYRRLKQTLAGTSLPPSSAGQQLEMDVELAQAWILTATYEFVKTYHHEACLSAGCAFRLVHLMRLHQVDDASSSGASTMENNRAGFVEAEEKRRVFWMAFILEGLYGMRNRLPLMLTEHTITTNLPVSDHEFQNGQSTKTSTLSDCITERGQTVKSPLNECILLITMCARTLAHRRQSDERQKLQKLQKQQQQQQQHRYSYSSQSGDDQLEWRQWLDNMLSLRMQALEHEYPSLNDSSDPMLLFANFLAQACVIYLWREFQATDDLSGRAGCAEGDCDRRHQALTADYQLRACAAAQRTVELARSLPDLPFSKIHPFTPIPLFLSIEFLSYNDSGYIEAPLLRSLLGTIRQLIHTNNTQQSYTELVNDSNML